MSEAAMSAIPGDPAQSRDIVQAAIDASFCGRVHDIAEVAAGALKGGEERLLSGHGGSAADAQRLAGEMLSRRNYNRAPPAAAIALTTDGAVLTAISNDYGYKRMFERQILGLGAPATC